jgi:hypothetical protein
VIVEDGEWVTAAAAPQLKLTFEIHLPKLVGNRALEPLKSSMFGRLSRIQQVMAAQNGCKGVRAGQTLVSQIQ